MLLVSGKKRFSCGEKNRALEKYNKKQVLQISVKMAMGNKVNVSLVDLEKHSFGRKNKLNLNLQRPNPQPQPDYPLAQRACNDLTCTKRGCEEFTLGITRIKIFFIYTTDKNDKRHDIGYLRYSPIQRHQG